MTSRDLRWPELTQKWRHLIGSHLEVAVEGRKLGYTVQFTSYKAVARRRRQSRDRKWRHVTSGDGKCPKSDCFDWKSSWSCCRRPKTGVYCRFHFLQGCTHRRWQTRGRKWCHVTSGDQKWPGSEVVSPEVTGSGRRRPKTGVYCTFHFLQGCSSQEEAVTWKEMTSHDLRCPEVNQKWRHLSGSHLEVAVEAPKVAYTVHSNFYKAVTHWRRQSREEMTSHDLRRHEVTRKWRHLTGTHLEVAVERQELAYTVDFTSYKAVACKRRQSRDRKWRHVTSYHRKRRGSDVIRPAVTCKWL